MTDPPPASIELDGVSKRYAVGGRRRLFGSGGGHVWALSDVSFAVQPGECVGLIGHNGAGKTTVLRLLAGITRPTRGSIRCTGRVASLINLGAGFHPELTGRENIYLNGVILGLSRAAVRDRLEQIVEFADLGTYIDTPLKRYSSGMYARLGFAVAAHVDPDVLLVDEVLSVGDIGFQDRSIRKMLSFRDGGQAVVFVSHNLSAVEMMCQRTIWLDHGRIRMQGPTAEVVRAYLDAVDEALMADAASEPSADDAGEALVIHEVAVTDSAARPADDFRYGQSLRVKVHCLARRRASDVRCSVTVRGDFGPLFSAESERCPSWSAGSHELECVFESLPLLPGLYRVEVQLRDAESPAWAAVSSVAAFRVTTDLTEFGSDSLVGATKSRGGFLAVPYDWRVQTAAGDEFLPGLRLPSAE